MFEKLTAMWGGGKKETSEEERPEHLKEKTDILRAATGEPLLQRAIVIQPVPDEQQQIFIYLAIVNNSQTRLEGFG